MVQPQKTLTEFQREKNLTPCLSPTLRDGGGKLLFEKIVIFLLYPFFYIKSIDFFYKFIFVKMYLLLNHLNVH